MNKLTSIFFCHNECSTIHVSIIPMLLFSVGLILIISFFVYLYFINIFYIIQAIYVRFLFSHKAERQVWQQQLDQPLSQHGEDGVKMKAISVLCLNSTLVGIYQLTPKSNTGIEVKQFIFSVLMLEFIQWKLALKRFEKQKI